MRIALGVALAILLALPAAQAAAADSPATTEINFTDADSVRGERVRPRGEVIPVRSRPGRALLIRTRATFVPELLKDTEDL